MSSKGDKTKTQEAKTTTSTTTQTKTNKSSELDETNPIYNSSEISKASPDEERYTEKQLIDGAAATRERHKTSQKEIEDAKNIRGATFMVATASKALAILPGGVYLAGALNMANIMASAYTDSLKFKELLYDTMIILTNCYKIFVLINRATDTFTIAIHNKDGLDDLYKMIIGDGYDDKKYNELFKKELGTANDKKEVHRKKIKDNRREAYYLLDNIHQSHEIKEEIKIKMEKLMGLLLESAPDSVILTLYLDKTLNQQGFGDLIITECIQRRSDKKIKNKEFCISKDEPNNKSQIEASVKEENKIEDEVKTIFINTTATNVADTKKSFFERIQSKVSNLAKKLDPKKLYDNINKISDATEKMQETLVALSVINGLFIIMKTQYDEVMKYYEKHLDYILDNQDNIKIKQREVPNELSRYEKASYLIDLSNEYINFMVPPQLHSTITDTINQLDDKDRKEIIQFTHTQMEDRNNEEDNVKIIKEISNGGVK